MTDREFLGALASLGRPATRKDFPCLTQEENARRQRLKRQGLIAFEGGWRPGGVRITSGWTITPAGRAVLAEKEG